MCYLTRLSNFDETVFLTAHIMLYDVLFSITVFTFCLSLLLVHKVAVLKNDFHNLRRDINLPLNVPRIEQVSGKVAKMTKTKEVKYVTYYQKLILDLDLCLYRPDCRFSVISSFSLDTKSCTAQKAQSPLKMSFNRLKREEGSYRGESP